MAKVKVTYSGTKGPMKELGKAVKDNLRRELGSAGDSLRDQMKAAAPVDTGKLRGSISSVVRVYDNVVLSITGPEWTNEADAAKNNALEYGTQDKAPIGYVRGTLPSAKNLLLEACKKSVLGAIARIKQ